MSLKRSVLFGVALGVGCGLVRLAKADGLQDWIIAFGLTLIESATILGLDWFADRHRALASAYRASEGRISALEQALQGLDLQISEERARHAALLDQVNQREAEFFDVGHLAEGAAWVVEAAYREGINANKRLLEGGAV